MNTAPPELDEFHRWLLSEDVSADVLDSEKGGDNFCALEQSRGGNLVETGQAELMLEYKGYKISGSSTPMYMEGCESLGSVCKPDRNGSVIEVARIEGKIFKTMKEAEAHVLELARGVGG